MIASPDDLEPLDTQHERQWLEQAVAPLQERELVELSWMEEASWQELQSRMRGGPWHIFHFIGHGGFDTAADEGHIILTDEKGQALPLSTTQVGWLLADHFPLRLVLLNACEGAEGANKMYSRVSQPPWYAGVFQRSWQCSTGSAIRQPLSFLELSI